MAYEAVIGLEIHAQLLTATKIFCGCSTAFGARAEHARLPGLPRLPGALPVLNRAAVDCAVRGGARARLRRSSATSIFARKNYFYPDLPKGYQISQYERPLATGGGVDVDSDGGRPHDVAHHARPHGRGRRQVAARRLRRLATAARYVDFNRSGVPLIEIVTEPDLRSAAEAARVLQPPARACSSWLGVNDGNMEEGSLRCDANVSVRPAGTTALGTKAEVKNLNSFRYVQKALEYEIERQIDVLDERRPRRPGDAAVGSPRRPDRLDAQQGRSARLPLLPGAGPAAARRRRRPRSTAIRATMPELPDGAAAALRRRSTRCREYDAGVLTQSRELADYFEADRRAVGATAKAASNWVMGELMRQAERARQPTMCRRRRCAPAGARAA